MITDSTWLIEGKFRSARQIPNIAHIMMTTNRGWAVPAGNRARRFLVLDVSQQRAGDHSYFKALWHEVEHGGIEIFLDLLLRTPVNDGDLRAVPRTAALRQQQLQSADTMTRWATDAASIGELVPAFGSARQPVGGFGSQQPTRVLYGAYADWCVGMHARPESKVEFGRWLGRCGFTRAHTNQGQCWIIPDTRTFITAVLLKAGIA